MPDMPGLVSRPRLMRLHDDYWNGCAENRRRFALGLLTGDSVAGVFRQLGIGRAADWRHLEREFCGEEGALSYWPYNRFGYLGNKDEILRQGALEAIRIADGLPESSMTRAHFSKPAGDKPVERLLETWWMCSGNRFQVNVLDGRTQVTMMILTPAMPSLPDNRKPKLEEDGMIWTVGHKHVLSGYLNEYRADQARYPELMEPYKTSGNPRHRRELGRINIFTDERHRR